MQLADKHYNRTSESAAENSEKEIVGYPAWGNAYKAYLYVDCYKIGE